MIPVDVLTPLKPGHTIPDRVLEALEDQGDVSLRHYVVEGPPRPGEPRTLTIARARNRAKALGSARYVMFLDRDIVLPPRGIEKLVYALRFNPRYAALGINCREEVPPPVAPHVAMAAALFHRPLLDRITFRAEPHICECYFCRRDLRRMGYCIDYIPGLRAEHLG
jgi:hypothetical protein